MRIAIVKAAFDGAAGVWCVEHSDIEGLHVEGDTFETFRRNVAAAADLMEEEVGGAKEIHIEIIAHASVRARVAT